MFYKAKTDKKCIYCDNKAVLTNQAVAVCEKCHLEIETNVKNGNRRCKICKEIKLLKYFKKSNYACKRCIKRKKKSNN